MPMIKWIAEGTQEEMKIVLVWVLYTPRITVSLPPDKDKACIMQIQQILNSNNSSNKKLESIIG